MVRHAGEADLNVSHGAALGGCPGLGHLARPHTGDRAEGAVRLPWAAILLRLPPGAGSPWSVSLPPSVTAAASGRAGGVTEVRKSSTAARMPALTPWR